METIVKSPVYNLQDQITLAKTLAASRLLPDAYKGHPEDILVAIGLGQEMGISPIQSIYRINVIKGKPTASAELLASMVRKAGHKLIIEKDENAQSATATIIRKDDPDHPFSVTRDKKWAYQMGLIDKENYKKQPMTMLTWRAITAVAREACSECLYGVLYTPDEMNDLDDIPPINVDVSKETKPEPEITPAQIKLGNIMREAKEYGVKPSHIKSYAQDTYKKEITELNDYECEELCNVIKEEIEEELKNDKEAEQLEIVEEVEF